MKNPPLILKEIFLVPLSFLRNGMQNDEIIQISQSISSEYYTPGTGQFEEEKKENRSGIYYECELRYSIPSLLTDEEMKKYDKIGAAILVTEDNRRIVFYKNDYFSNTPLRFSISSQLEKTIIKTSIISVNPL